MVTIQVNGKTYSDLKVLESLEIRNGVVKIDGVVQENINAKGVMEVLVSGPVHNLITDANVSACNVTGNLNAGGNVKCDNVGGNVAAGGHVNCDEISGTVVAGGDVKYG